MKIIADENMPLVQELFSPFGEVVTLSGREMSAAQLADADVLLVRSVTEVNRDLLEGTNIQFVGTATIGTDHIDETYLQQRGIGFASAPGCNANAVVQYVLSAFSALLPDWQQKTVGIVGCGNVGGRLYQRLTALGMTCRCYDPFLSEEGIVDLVNFESVIDCDIICLHTPLTTDGPYPTYHLFDEAVLSKLRPETLLLNAGRGAVIDGRVLMKMMSKKSLQVVLDVWEGEPAIDTTLMQQVALATPHIAGYSYDGKIRGTEMIRDALCTWLGQPCPESKGVEGAIQEIVTGSLSEAILASYDIRKDDKQMRQGLLASGINGAAEFDSLRKHYPQRLEFQHFRNSAAVSALLQQQLLALGFSG